MTKLKKRRRLFVIKLLAEGTRYEQGSFARPMSTAELDQQRIYGAQAGATWVFNHRGLRDRPDPPMLLALLSRRRRGTATRS